MKGSCNFWRCANRVGLFLAILFAICFLWFYINPVEQEMHLSMFRISYLGFEEMNFTGFVLGAVQSYLWAYVGLGVWQLVGYCFKPSECCKN